MCRNEIIHVLCREKDFHVIHRIFKRDQKPTTKPVRISIQKKNSLKTLVNKNRKLK